MKFLKIDIKSANSSYKPPHFLGSQLRGAFGVSLKDVVCINPTRDCENCFAKENCIYYEFYEEKNRFLNFRLDFELYPKNLDFSLYLFNNAIEKYPYILSAIHKMFTKTGFGKDRKKLKIDSIFLNDKKIYEKENFLDIELESKNFQNDNFCPVIKLKLITPLRIKREGRFLKPENLSIKDILISINKKRKFYDDIEEHIEKFPKESIKDLKFIDFDRYSNRQRTKMKIGGIVGEMIITDLTPQTYNLLKYGEISGVGKLNSFGLGKIEIEDLI